MRKLHPLHDVGWLTRVMQTTGCYPDPDRATGRTTAQAHRLIAEAMSRPGVAVNTVDHHGSTAANEHLCRLTNDLVNQLGYRGFTFTVSTIKFG